MPAFGPRIGIQNERMPDAGVRQPAKNRNSIGIVQTHITDAGLIDMRQQFGHAVDEWLAADDAHVAICLRLRDQVLTAAEADFQPYVINRRVEQGRGSSGPLSGSRNRGSRSAISSACLSRRRLPLRLP